MAIKVNRVKESSENLQDRISQLNNNLYALRDSWEAGTEKKQQALEILIEKYTSRLLKIVEKQKK